MIAVSDSELERKIADYDREVSELQGQLKLLEEELALTRRKAELAPRRIHELEKRLTESSNELAGARDNNERLASTLREAREQLVAMKEEIEKLSKPPASYGIFLEPHKDQTADVFTNGRKLRVNVTPEIDIDTIVRGQEVILNEAMNVIDYCNFEVQGEVVTLK
ncbi:MAG: proteasome ATPase, partial [Actinomycetota bacterium]